VTSRYELVQHTYKKIYIFFEKVKLNKYIKNKYITHKMCLTVGRYKMFTKKKDQNNAITTCFDNTVYISYQFIEIKFY
jgi:hypothetical protein